MTDNDMGCLLPFKAAQWKIASEYLSTKYEHGTKASDYEVEQGDDNVKVIFTYHLPTRPAADCTLIYDVNSDGVVDVELSMDGADEIGQLPEFGVMFVMDADFDRLKWYGLGPKETYSDKNHAKLGVYENSVADNMARYLSPQECGNKVGVRMARVSDDKGFGLEFFGDELSFSALPYSPFEIENARHPNELPPINSTFIRVASAQLGIGGDDSWGAEVHEEYHINTKERLVCRFSFRGTDKN